MAVLATARIKEEENLGSIASSVVVAGKPDACKSDASLSILNGRVIFLA
jgi:hypothetical protein